MKMRRSFFILGAAGLAFTASVCGAKESSAGVQNAGEQEEIVYSNKLTDEEKRKYGSTRDLQAPEAYEDESTQEAEETLYGGDYENP